MSAYRHVMMGTVVSALVTGILVGCGTNNSANDDVVEGTDHPVTGSYLTTNGVPISIQLPAPGVELPREETLMVLSFPGKEEADGDDDYPEATDEESADERVKMVLLVLPYDADSTEPTEPEDAFEIGFKDNHYLNWIWVERGEENPFPRRYKYRVRLREHVGQLPTGYFSVAVKVVNGNEEAVKEEADPDNEKEPARVKPVGMFRIGN